MRCCLSRVRPKPWRWRPFKYQCPTIPSRPTWIHVRVRFATTTNDIPSTSFLDRYRMVLPTADQIKRERCAVLQKIKPQIYRQVYDEIWQAQQRNVPIDSQLWAVGPAGQGLYQWTTTKSENDSQASRLYQRKSRESLGMEDSPSTLLTLPEGTSLESSPCLSPDERYLAYLAPVCNNDGGNKSFVVLVDTCTLQAHYSNLNDNLPPNTVHVEIGAALPNGNYPIFLLQGNQEGRPHQVWRAEFSPTRSSSPKLIWSVANDPTLYLNIHGSKGGQYLVAQAQSLDSNQVYLLGGCHKDCSVLTWHVVAPHTPGRIHHVDVGADGEVFILVKDETRGHCLIETNVTQLPLEQDPFAWPDKYSVLGYEITEIDLYRYWIVLYEVSTSDARPPRIRVVDRRMAGEAWVVDIPINAGVAAVQTFHPVHNAWHDATSFRFQVDTPFHPSVVCEYNFVSRQLHQVGGESFINGNDYETERVGVSSCDGTVVPLSIIRKREAPRTDSLSVILTTYGAYGQNVDLAYSPIWQPLLNRGFAVAFAHIRGGGERGIKWHAQGRRDKKLHSVEDYLACARALQDYLFGSRSVRLVAKAFSAGGVVVASAVNREPDLFYGLVLTNAFLDVYATMCNVNLPLTEHEWDEYGNPLEDEQIALLIRSYCPVQMAVGTRNFPRTLLTCALDDEAVPCWNAVTFAEALRRNSEQGRKDVSLLLESGVGHDLGGKLIHVSSVEVAFILSNEKN